MKTLIAAFFSALLFGLGLSLSGMTRPEKVIGFLDVTGEWDPSLLFVMAGAIIVHSISYRLIIKRRHPVLASSFQIPTRRYLDAKLIVGAVLFGAGWGMGGFCPGPAIVSLVTLTNPVLTFSISMVGGILLHNIIMTKSKT